MEDPPGFQASVNGIQATALPQVQSQTHGQLEQFSQQAATYMQRQLDNTPTANTPSPSDTAIEQPSGMQLDPMRAMILPDFQQPQRQPCHVHPDFSETSIGAGPNHPPPHIGRLSRPPVHLIRPKCHPLQVISTANGIHCHGHML